MARKPRERVDTRREYVILRGAHHRREDGELVTYRRNDHIRLTDEEAEKLGIGVRISPVETSPPASEDAAPEVSVDEAVSDSE